MGEGEMEVLEYQYYHSITHSLETTLSNSYSNYCLDCSLSAM